MSSEEFAIAYDGPALASHTMDVQTLGPALVAIGHLCEEANRVINGSDFAAATVRVKSTGEGCFDIALEMVQRVYDSAADLVRADETATAKEIIEWLGFGAIPLLGLLGFRKWKRGRKVIKQETATNGDGATVVNVTVEGDGNNVIALSPIVHKLASDPKVVAALRRILDPLTEAGVEEFRIRRGGKTTASVSANEVDDGYFDLDPDEFGGEEPANDPQSFDAVLVLRAPVFVQDSRWQFFLGDQRVSATLSDAEFIKSVFEGGARFGVGDRFRVRLCLMQVLLSTGKIRNDYEILKVIEIIPGPKQLDLSLDGGDPEDDDANSS